MKYKRRREIEAYRRKGNKPIRFIQYPAFWQNEDKTAYKVWRASVSQGRKRLYNYISFT